MKKNSIRAFTIMEMTVAMLISAIVIGITYAIYNIVVGSYTSFNNKNNKMAVVLRVDELLQKDISNADKIIKNQQGFLLARDSEKIYYEIQPNFIVRINSVTDTFKIQTDSLKIRFETIPLVETNEDEEQNRIDDISFIVRYDDKFIPYNYHKYYSSVNLFHRNHNAIN